MPLHNSMAINLLALLLTLFCQIAHGQTETRKTEIGVQVSTLLLGSRFNPGPGVGGRLTYNFTNSLALEGELNYFPYRPNFNRLFAEGDERWLGLLGVKAGYRQRRFGLFLKLRPGFMQTDKVNFTCSFSGSVVPDQCLQGKLQFALDGGGVAEFYPGDRFLLRVDAGNTLIRLDGPGTRRPLQGYLQINAGVGYRF